MRVLERPACLHQKRHVLDYRFKARTVKHRQNLPEIRPVRFAALDTPSTRLAFGRAWLERIVQESIRILNLDGEAGLGARRAFSASSNCVLGIADLNRQVG